jgi:hypothetical protein
MDERNRYVYYMHMFSFVLIKKELQYVKLNNKRINAYMCSTCACCISQYPCMYM